MQSPIVARIILQYVNDKRKNKNTYELTLREKDILESLTCGNSYKMIADKFEISIGTVTTHIKNIYGKLGVHSQAEAVAKALKEGLV
ncbi:MAG: LuxR C-terminal-related transcriptional regulator [Chitinophagales bacterium]|nr:LuxR C-terminal-related transcriptional regulator [Chitinophagales bacterium]